MQIRWLIAAAAACLLQACASAPRVPAQASATKAVVVETATGGGNSGAAFFFVEEIDGKPVGATILSASRAASYGLGANMRTVGFDREVPVGKVRLKLAGRYGHAAPIQSIFSSAASWAAEGVLEAELKPNTIYRVNGVLDSFKREVWLEDDTGTVVGRKFVGAGLADAKLAQIPTSFTCCNLRYDGDWISDANWSTLPFVPAGSSIALVDYGRHRANVLIDGRPMRVGHDYGREQETREQFVAKLMVKDDPKLRIASYPAEVQAAIAAGKVMKGMTREQVIVTLGYPRTDKTRSLQESEWTYWTQNAEEFVVLWGQDQIVKEVDAPRSLRRRVMHGEM